MTKIPTSFPSSQFRSLTVHKNRLEFDLLVWENPILHDEYPRHSSRIDLTFNKANVKSQFHVL